MPGNAILFCTLSTWGFLPIAPPCANHPFCKMSECGLPASREVAAYGVSHPRTESPRVGASLPVGRRYGGRIIIDRQPLSGGVTLVLMQIGGDHRILSVL